MAYQINIANREINPRVINFFTFENQVTTLEFTLDNYIYDEVDLRNYRAYAVTSNKGSVDMTELEMRYDEVDDKLILTWNVGDYTLTQEGAIVYQITFKQNENDGEDSAVWYSYKAIMINRGTVDAEYKIVAEYPTIMAQWLKKMDDLYGQVNDVANTAMSDITTIQAELNEYATKFTNSVFYIPYDERIPVEERMAGRLYFQYTDADKTKGRFEDPEGNGLVAEAKGGSSLPMFAPVWSDHLYNDASFLRADTFSWHNSEIYVSAYDKLLKEYNNESSVEETDENGITYKLSLNGFKIADASQEDAILDLYVNGEKAWYYIIDIDNARFKLPRERKSDGKYLYFFVGIFDREDGEINVGILTEMANGTDISVIVNEINAIKEQAIAELESVGIEWGKIKGTLSNQTDLQNALNNKADVNSLSGLIRMSDVEAKNYATQAQIDSLTAQVSALQVELNTMIGRMDFANSVEFIINNTTSYTCPKDGYIQFIYIDNSTAAGVVNINGKKIASGYTIGNGLISMIPVSSGDVISVPSASVNVTAVFIPQKGA